MLFGYNTHMVYLTLSFYCRINAVLVSLIHILYNTSSIVVPSLCFVLIVIVVFMFGVPLLKLFGKSKTIFNILITFLSFDYPRGSIKRNSAFPFLIAIFNSYHSVSIILSRNIFMESIVNLADSMSMSAIA